MIAAKICKNIYNCKKNPTKNAKMFVMPKMELREKIMGQILIIAFDP